MGRVLKRNDRSEFPRHFFSVIPRGPCVLVTAIGTIIVCCSYSYAKKVADVFVGHE